MNPTTEPSQRPSSPFPAGKQEAERGGGGGGSARPGIGARAQGLRLEV